MTMIKSENHFIMENVIEHCKAKQYTIARTSIGSINYCEIMQNLNKSEKEELRLKFGNLVFD